MLPTNREVLGTRYRGDVDAPRVISISEPELGWSMELDRHSEHVWSALRSTAAQLDPQVEDVTTLDTTEVLAQRLVADAQALRQV